MDGSWAVGIGGAAGVVAGYDQPGNGVGGAESTFSCAALADTATPGPHPGPPQMKERHLGREKEPKSQMRATRMIKISQAWQPNEIHSVNRSGFLSMN